VTSRADKEDMIVTPVIPLTSEKKEVKPNYIFPYPLTSCPRQDIFVEPEVRG
jgi:hypothetical protein